MNTISYNTSLAFTSTYLTILDCQTPVLLKAGHFQFHMESGDILLLREKINCHSDKELNVISCQKDFFDDLFYSQISDCKIIYDFLHAENISEEHLYFAAKDNISAQQILHLLKQEFAHDDVYQTKLMHALIVGLMTYLDRNRQDELILSRSSMVSQNRFGMILKYIGDHYATVTLADTAAHFSYNPSYLSAHFKDITGETFTHKVLSVKLNEAAQMLLNTDYSVEEISAMCGFKDKSYFIRKFREVYGTTPGAYRREAKK